MEVVLYPDPRLLAPTAKIEEITPDLRERITEMMEVMYQQDGAGLAAPQVGWSARLFVMNPTGDPNQQDREQCVINPRILRRRGREWGVEGCLSFPDMAVEVERAKAITVERLDLDSGEVVREELEGFPARVFQHELDHLENVLLVHRMTAAEKVKHRTALDNLRRAAT